MLISMTGFGQGEATSATSSVTVEVRSVNHRFLDLAFKLPRVIQNREADIKDIVRAKLARGRFTITINIESPMSGRAITINEHVLETYLTQLRAFARKHNLDERLSMEALIQLPEVVTAKELEPGEDEVWPLVEKSLNGALDACTKMRVDEGKALEKDLVHRMQIIDRTVSAIEKLSPEVARQSSPVRIVVSGPSGAGETTLVDRLLAADPLIHRSISATTRAPRPGEKEGTDYFFVARPRFDELKQNNELIERAEVHGQLYGTRQTYVEEHLAAGFDVLPNIDIQGGDRVKRMFPGAVMVFI